MLITPRLPLCPFSSWCACVSTLFRACARGGEFFCRKLPFFSWLKIRFRTSSKKFFFLLAVRQIEKSLSPPLLVKALYTRYVCIRSELIQHKLLLMKTTRQTNSIVYIFSLLYLFHLFFVLFYHLSSARRRTVISISIVVVVVITSVVIRRGRFVV